MQRFLRISFFFMLVTHAAYPQWIQHQLPALVDVWGLESKDSLVFAGTEIGFQMPGYVFRSTDHGVSWDTLGGLPFAGGWSLIYSDPVLVAGSFGSGLYLSEDLGVSWATPDSGIGSNENVHVIIKHGEYLFAGTVAGSGILRSSDNGKKWISVNAGLPVFSFLSLASNGVDLYVGTAFTGEVYRSTDNGEYWFFAGNGLPPNQNVTSLVARDSTVYAGIDSELGVYYSNDYGSNWINISVPSFYKQVWTVALSDTNLFAGTIGAGVFLTQNNGMSWTQINEGLTNLNIRSLTISDDDYLFAGTTNGFVCTRPLSEIITAVRETENKQPSVYTLSQNYPNPFNNSSVLRYSIPNSSQVILKIYNTLGEEIETLVNEEKQAGTYEISWATSGLPSGVYFYRLQAGDFVQTKKMILLK
jgi:photosystem II stability/assembly factor-like uncharacterized protein